jgi:hypothetical protein
MPSPTEAELLAIRLARIKNLIDVLETVTGRTAQQQDAFIKLKQEMAALRESLKTIPT